MSTNTRVTRSSARRASVKAPSKPRADESGDDNTNKPTKKASTENKEISIEFERKRLGILEKLLDLCEFFHISDNYWKPVLWYTKFMRTSTATTKSFTQAIMRECIERNLKQFKVSEEESIQALLDWSRYMNDNYGDILVCTWTEGTDVLFFKPKAEDFIRQAKTRHVVGNNKYNRVSVSVPSSSPSSATTTSSSSSSASKSKTQVHKGVSKGTFKRELSRAKSRSRSRSRSISPSRSRPGSRSRSRSGPRTSAQSRSRSRPHSEPTSRSNSRSRSTSRSRSRSRSRSASPEEMYRSKPNTKSRSQSRPASSSSTENRSNNTNVQIMADEIPELNHSSMSRKDILQIVNKSQNNRRSVAKR